MKCFRCGKKLGKSDICLTCGQDVRLYRKIIATSYQYYDRGLQKAKVRDLSGAIEELKNSLALYKYNIEGRNLLGLIYYEMGDIAEALIQWVICTHLDPDDQKAPKLLHKVQSDQMELERGSTMIRKYNIALRYMQNDGEDLAVLQLNKVISVHPRMVRANLLMALLQLHQGQNEKAEKYIRNVLQIDRKNPIALGYLEDIKGGKRRLIPKDKISFTKEPEERKPLSGEDVIIPTYSETRVGLQTVLEVFAGIVIGAVAVAYLVMPSKMSGLRSDFNQTIISYSERLSAKEAIISAQEDDIRNLEEQIAAMEEREKQSGDVSLLRETQYKTMIQCLEYRAAGEYLQGVKSYLSIDPGLIEEEVFIQCYQGLKKEYDKDAYEVLMAAGKDLYERRKYANAMDYFDTCYGLENTSEAKYWVALTFIRLKDKESAIPYLESIVAEDPEGPYTEEARSILGN